MILKRPTVFISYNQKSGDTIADQIQTRLESIAQVVRDKNTIPDWGSIKDFMKSIRNQDMVVMIITAEYLKSSGCMFEVVEAMKDEGWNKHTMFVVTNEVEDIYSAQNWAKYLDHWKTEEIVLNRAIELVDDSTKSIQLAEELRKVKEIQASLIDFLSCVADTKNPSIHEAVEKIYRRVNENLSGTEDLKETPIHDEVTEGDPNELYALGRAYESKKDGKQDYVKAVSYYRRAAELGHIEAQYHLGVAYEFGLGVEINYEKATYWYRKAAEQGDACGQYLLAVSIYKQSKGNEREYLKAAEWYQKAAEQGYVPAQSALSRMYENGVGVKQDYEKAVFWSHEACRLTQQSAEQGDSDAQYRLGNMYTCGEPGLEKDVQTAVRWYKKAAALGHRDAQLHLGELYEKGKDVTQDYGEAIEWYEKAGAQGSIRALLRLGDLYTEGKGVERNYFNAQKNYKAVEDLLVKAANDGKVWAQNELAYLYQCGKISETDCDKAIYWYEKAAAQGNTHAMDCLYRIYHGRERYNPEAALKWKQQAASQGSNSAMTSLGTMFLRGDGVEQNYDTAIFWYQQAVAQGDFFAIEKLGDMYEQGLGTGSNMEKAAELYVKYAHLGINYARWRLGYMYENGLGIEQDDGQAAKWYQRAAEHGSKRAQYSLACMYLDGRGVFKDIETAISWYRRAADGVYGHMGAQRMLGQIYLYGIDVQKDYHEALKWFMAAGTKKHDCDAQAYLGYMYENGFGVEQNIETALNWYRESAKRSDIGQYYLGSMYERGVGVPQSDTQAAALYQQAANSGNADAQIRLAEIYKRKGDHDKANEWYARANGQNTL